MILHTVNKSPFTSHTLSDCLNVAGQDDAILFIENGVYSAVTSPLGLAEHLGTIERMIANGTQFYVLEADLQARGIEPHTVANNIKSINDEGFVSLASSARAVQSWY